MHEEMRKDISALFDGELEEPRASEVRRHLESCPACLAYLEELRSASSALKAQDRAALPDSVRAAVLASAAGARKVRRPFYVPALKLAAVACSILVLFVLFGLGMRRYMPSLFGQVQNLIGGAVGTLGSSSGNR